MSQRGYVSNPNITVFYPIMLFTSNDLTVFYAFWPAKIKSKMALKRLKQTDL